MTVSTVYQSDTQEKIHRGALYGYRPVFWLSPPLWLARDVHFGNPGHATIQRADQSIDAFKRKQSQANEEFVLATAKVRPIIILSSNWDAQDERQEIVLVAPIYTLNSQRDNFHFVQKVRTNSYRPLHYLPQDPFFPDTRESYVDFRHVRAIHRQFLREGKLDICLTPISLKALLARYSRFLLLE